MGILNYYDEKFYRQESLPELSEGDSNDSVIILQEKLKILGFYNGSITGSFDYYTKSAVTNFQEVYDLNPTGIVDDETWEELYTLTQPQEYQLSKSIRPTLRLGDTGEDVKYLQTRLSELMYYDGPINGIFDTNTQTAVKEFQTNNKLTADGIVGRYTWSALETLYSPLAICKGNEVPPNTITYTVVAGDTLYGIANRYGTTVDAIKKLNNLSSNTLSIGQKLLIPSASSSSNITYTVVAGDTLYGIANRYGTTVDAIKKLNNLSSNTLSIGQKLLIPK